MKKKKRNKKCVGTRRSGATDNSDNVLFLPRDVTNGIRRRGSKRAREKGEGGKDRERKKEKTVRNSQEVTVSWVFSFFFSLYISRFRSGFSTWLYLMYKYSSRFNIAWWAAYVLFETLLWPNSSWLSVVSIIPIIHVCICGIHIFIDVFYSHVLCTSEQYSLRSLRT